jgi:hypothetical protein
MGIGEQWLSVIMNSPVFQEELRKRLEVEEGALVKRLAEQETRRIEALSNMMRDGVGDPAILSQPSIFDLGKTRKTHEDTEEGIGELMIKTLSRMDDARTEKLPSVAQSLPTPAKAPTPCVTESVMQPTAVPSEDFSTVPTKEARHMVQQGSDKVQAAKFYSRVLGKWMWIVLDYPGGRDAYYQASQALGLTNASQWKVYPRSGPPPDGYARYYGEEILQLSRERGRTLGSPASSLAQR